MKRHKPDKEDLTANYLPVSQQILQSSHWVDEFGNVSKIPVGLKLYYQYRLSAYEFHIIKNGIYHQTNKSCANALGLSVSSIETTYNRMLKDMGLISFNKYECISSTIVEDGEVVDKFDNRYKITVNKLSSLKGWLINPKLKNNSKVTNFEYDTKINYEQLQNLEHNKRQAKRVASDVNKRHYLITESQHKILRDALKGVI